MVATENTSGIAASFKLDGIAPISRENSREWITKAKHLQGNQTRVGWISRKQSRSDRGGSFFLTSLFIELIDCRGSVSSNSWVLGCVQKSQEFELFRISRPRQESCVAYDTTTLQALHKWGFHRIDSCLPAT